MFYVCKACDDGCKGCSKGCSQCCKACDDVCGGCTKCMNQACAPVAQVCDRPLGSYVVMTWIFSIPAAGMAGASLVNAGVKACTVVPLMVSNVANVGLALVHAAFAIYLQQRLVHLLRQAGGEAADQDPSAKDLMRRAWDIVLYDVGFCIYVVIFVGSFGFNCYAMSWPGRCNVGTPLPFFASLLLVLFAFAAGYFALMWWCALACQDCCGGLFGRQTPVKFVLGRRYGQPQGHGFRAQVIGQPVGYAAQPPVAQVMHPAPGPAAQVAATGHPQPVYATAQTVQASAPPAGGPGGTGRAAAGSAAKVAGAGLGLAGQGLQMAGKWLGEKGKSTGGRRGDGTE
eukprot:TRINITY_DN94101_c0_g1_i1.p1 TRINITY_DN94101_c0_g1~~TRINITY_DN94101_c0_g1_i1.p1  ORF type:complete len:342 (+),score=50.72 TRINITY_DN94101_c0_g1_i1:57-1082(+)